MRNLQEPVLNLPWKTVQSGDVVNPVINAVRFIPYQDLVLAGATDSAAAKCFNIKTGSLVENFTRLSKSCYTLDVSLDGQMAAMGDGTGAVHFETINYTS